MYGIVLAHVLEHGAEVVGRPCSPTSPSPRWSRTPTSGCSSALFAAGYALAVDAARPARSRRAGTPVVTRFQIASFSAGSARAVGRLRLADPRPRRALPLLGAHGAARHVLDHRRAAAADRHAHVARALAALAAGGCCSRCATCRASSRPRSCSTSWSIVTHIAGGRERRAAQRAPALRHPHADLRVVADRVDAAAEPAARGAAPAAARCGCCSCSCSRSCRRCPRRSSRSATHPLYSFYDHVPAAVRASRRSTTCRSPASIMKIGVGFSPVDHHRDRLLPLVQRRGGRHAVAPRVARPRPRADGVAAAMTTDTPDLDEHDPPPPKPSGDAAADAPPVPAAPAKPPFWQRPDVERYLVPLVLPLLVVAAVVVFVLNISRVFLSAHGHIPVVVGIGHPADDPHRRVDPRRRRRRCARRRSRWSPAASSSSIMLVGWLVLGHSEEKGGAEATLPGRGTRVGGAHVRVAQRAEVRSLEGATRKTGIATITLNDAAASTRSTSTTARRCSSSCSVTDGRRHGDGPRVLRRGRATTPSSARSPATARRA